MDWVPTVALAVAVGMLTVATVKLYSDLRSARRKARTEQENTMQFQKLVKELTNVVSSYDNEVAHLRREVERLGSESRSTRPVVLPSSDLERQKLAQRQREAEWKKIGDIAKGIGWILDRVEYEEDGEE